jgi:hypothetical protein
MFKIDHSQAKEGFTSITPGEYEVTVINFELKKSSTDKNVVSVDYEIRSDVDQDFQARKILYDNFIVSENTMWRFQSASKAAGFPNGKEFNSFKEWAEFFLHKNLRLVVGEREYNGKKYVQVKGFKPSQAEPPMEIVIDDSSVPF